ncbi:hypothetical protein MHYP_G00111260 [Metynnis hypsauchen]
MDPAELDPISSALQNQGAVIGRHEQLLQDMMQQLTLLVKAHTEGAQPASANASTGVGAGAAASAATPVLASPLPPTDPNPIHSDALVANPEGYAGDPETRRGFLLQCSLVFEQQPSWFPTERSKVAYMISLLTGRALAWATSLWEQDSPDTASGESFKRAMCTTFHNPCGGREILAPLRWELETAIREAQQREPEPGGGPPGKLYVPTPVQQQVLWWGHASPFTGHPGVNRTLDFLRRRFWWPSMQRDACAFVASCETCARCKAPRSRPQGPLHPLPIPARPWSHVSLDFVTGLPPSRGNTAILVLVDRFSKACKFVALPKLPSAKLTSSP